MYEQEPKPAKPEVTDDVPGRELTDEELAQVRAHPQITPAHEVERILGEQPAPEDQPKN